jgi:hypothetical protein
MLKGILLGISMSVFIVSLIIFVAGLTGGLQENILTGAVIGPGEAITYSAASLLLSGILVLLVIVWMRR